MKDFNSVKEVIMTGHLLPYEHLRCDVKERCKRGLGTHQNI
jgi:hypothetical protein